MKNLLFVLLCTIGLCFGSCSGGSNLSIIDIDDPAISVTANGETDELETDESGNSIEIEIDVPGWSTGCPSPLPGEPGYNYNL